MINRIRDAYDLIRRTAAGKAVLEEHELEIATEREVKVTAIKEAEAQLVDALPKLNDAVAKTQAQWDRARKAADADEATHRAARLARGNAVHRAEHVRQTHQQELAKGGDPRIPGVCVKLRLLYMKEATGGLVAEHEKTGLYEQLTGDPQVRVSTNSAARLRRMAAMLNAIHAIKALQFHAKADVSEEMEAILRDIPDGSVCEFVYESYMKELRGQRVIDLYRPVDVAREFSEVLAPAEFVFRDADGGSGGGFVENITSRPMAR